MERLPLGGREGFPEGRVLVGGFAGGFGYFWWNMGILPWGKPGKPRKNLWKAGFSPGKPHGFLRTMI